MRTTGTTGQGKKRKYRCSTQGHLLPHQGQGSSMRNNNRTLRCVPVYCAHALALARAHSLHARILRCEPVYTHLCILRVHTPTLYTLILRRAPTCQGSGSVMLIARTRTCTRAHALRAHACASDSNARTYTVGAQMCHLAPDARTRGYNAPPTHHKALHESTNTHPLTFPAFLAKRNRTNMGPGSYTRPRAPHTCLAPIPMTIRT